MGRSPLRARVFCVLLTLVAWAACTTGERILSVNATGIVRGLAFLDRNGNLLLEATDGPVQGIAIRVVPAGAAAPVARVVTTLNGEFVVPDLAVGDYEIVVESGSIPDSLSLLRVIPSERLADTTKVRVTPSDTTTVFVVLSFPVVTVAEARQTVPGKRVFVEGVTMNALTTFGDSTLHIADTAGVAIRATRVAAAPISAGQRVRLLGLTAVRDGQPILTDVTSFVLGSGTVPPPTVVTTAVAGRADGGRLDARLVRVSGATILSAQTSTTGDFVLTVTDGSSPLSVVIDRESGIATAPYVPGAFLAVTGLLIPSEATSGLWVLKPRTPSDLTVSFPTATIAEARRMQAGSVVQIEAIALNAWATYADSTVHIADATGSMRAVRVQPANLFAGDRVRMLGTIVFRDGQPTLSNVTPTALGPGVLPLPQTTTTAGAASADGGSLDAALVRGINFIVADTATVGGDFRLTVDDGTGLLEVLLDRDAGFQLRSFEPGAILDVTGLLTPSAGGRTWTLKPRQQSDIVLVGTSNTTIAQARTLAAGTVVSLEGVALNAWNAFADSTVHLSDGTGFIRAVRVRSAPIVIGSRVRLLGTIALRDGQPVLSNATPAILGQSAAPLPASLTTGSAASADGGRLDAALARVVGPIVDTATVANGDFRIRIDDASGVLEVLLDRDLGTLPPSLLATLTPGRRIDVTGVLVPVPTTTRWTLKPRIGADLIVLPITPPPPNPGVRTPPPTRE